MKYLTLAFFLLPVALFAQLQVQVTGSSTFSFLPSTADGRATDSQNSLGVVVGTELWLAGKKDKYPFGAFLRYGRVFATRLNADFSGQAAGSTPENERTIFVQTTLKRFDYLQFGLTTKLPLYSSKRVDGFFQLGGGLHVIRKQETHLAVSEFHQGVERLQIPTSGYEIDKDGIRESSTFVNGITLLEDMLIGVTPFLEAGMIFDTRNGAAGFLNFQLGLIPIVDPDLYPEDLRGRVWLQLSGGMKGRLF